MLRDYQVEAVNDLRRHVAQGHRAPLLQMATGLGKTIVACSAIHSAVEKGKSVLVLAPRRQLVFQTSEKLDLFGVEHGVIMSGEIPSLMPQVQIASVNTLYRRCFEDGEAVQSSFYGKGMPLPPADLVVIDEAHANFSNMAQSIIAEYPDAVKIGMTATPCRADGRGLGEVYDAVVTGPSVNWAVERGWLSPLRYFGPSEWDLTGVKVQAGDYHQGQLSKAVNKPKLVGDVVENWERIAPERTTVVFAVDRRHARALHDAFTKAGHFSEYIDGQTDNEERHDIFARLESGKSRVLCSVAVVDMGWDCLDEDTEILTADGWRGIDDIEDASHVWALNTDSGAAELVEIQETGSRPVRKGERMLTVESQYMDVRTTEGHRFYVKKRYGRRAQPGAEFRVKTGRELHDEDRSYYLPLSARADLPGVGLSDDELRLAAWILTDGYLYPDGKAAEIYQSKEDNIRRIRDMLDRIGLSHSERRRVTSGYKESESTVFRIRQGELKPHFLEVLVGDDGRKDLRNTMERMTEAQFDVFWWEMLLGDGEQLRPDNLGGYLWTASRGVSDRLSAMGALRGYHVVVREKELESGVVMYVVGARKRSFMRVGQPQTADNRNHQTRKFLSVPSPGERVWCVTNRLGTLVTRRNGKVSILGNCPVASCAVLARPTKSLGRYLQAVGRILRPSPGKDDAVLIDHTGAVRELGFVDDDFQWTLSGVKRAERKTDGGPEDVTTITCPACKAVIRPAPQCPECGKELKSHAKRAIAAKEAELEEIEKKNAKKNGREWTLEEKARFLSGLLGYAKKKQYKKGWAVFVYEERLGVKPWPVWPQPPTEPDEDTANWIKHRNIRNAKRREKEKREAVA